MKKINILLVDDHDIIRDGIRSLLKNNNHINVVAEAGSGALALELIQTKKRIDVIIMDINMPEMNGIETTKEILKLNKDAKVLALSAHNEVAFIRGILAAGAKGYLLKNAGSEELIMGIETVNAGETYFSASVSEKMMDAMTKGNKTHLFDGTIPAPTKREHEVLSLLVDGATNKEIATKLGLSVRTIDAHRRSLLHKYNARNTAELLKMTYANNILQL